MPLFENHVGVSLSLDKIRLVELVYSDNEFILENVDEEVFGERLVVSSILENFYNILQNSFKEILSRNTLKSKNISFSLDPEFFINFEIPFDNTLLKKDLAEHIKWEFKKLHPELNADDYLIQNIELKKGEELISNVAAVLCLNKKIVSGLQKLSQTYKLNLRFVDYSHTSSDVLLRFKKSLKGLSGLSIYKSNNSFSLSILDDFKPIAMLKKRIQKNQLPMNVIKHTLNNLVGKRSGLSNFLYAYITGVNIHEDEIDRMNELFGLKFKLLNPFSDVTIGKNAQSKVELIENPTEYSSAVGIALRLF